MGTGRVKVRGFPREPLDVHHQTDDGVGVDEPTGNPHLRPDASLVGIEVPGPVELDPSLRVVIAEEVFEADVPVPNVA